MSDLSWHNAGAANGPALVAWLERHADLRFGTGHDNLAKLVRTWRNGGQASFHAVDRVLTHCHLHPSDVPDDVWELPRRGKPRKAEVAA